MRGWAQSDYSALIDGFVSFEVQTLWSRGVFVVRRLRFFVRVLAARRWPQEKAAISLSGYAKSLVQ
jgi:hypothetical protein